ncbi:LuxR family two component transcriptional regulator [Asanoa ferruginea]|uniref:LuxR family two component transcriptional regulator n=1 Tax=Asanoa ferruginea TaxID=53367 RepID=A0A3D9ZHL9_9ACTN|nr:response regulator transcription factor [Asanoa ferruginea]REF96737.1 LuxR family two component transcriptional regulator [Asanoa ferruginea]GIF53360.1 DNA-binding response regulator [Asanoa ferruginea]
MIKVMIAEDVRLLRESLAAVLELEDDLAVVATVERGDEIVDAAARARPDVALLDIDLPGLDGISGAGLLRDRVPSCRTVILTGLSRPGHLRRALAAGAAGFVLKHSVPQTLIDVIRKVAAGERVVDPQLALAALETPDSPLPAREIDVLRLAATGAGPEEIAATLFLSVGTVRNYLSSAITRLDARNRVDAIRIATDQGWL